jgi:hypothetical protein
MAKKGGLGTAGAPPAQEDLTDGLFGGERPKAPKRLENVKQGQKRVAKTFHVDRDLAVQLKIYAAQNGLKEHQVVDAALRKFFAGEAG